MSKAVGNTKKERIITSWNAGQHDIWILAEEYVTTPSYVASVLQKSGAIENYHDLFTSPESPINVYSGLFKDKVGFKTVAAAEKSVALIHTAFQALGDLRDRAGQHHCMVAALTMFNRAMASGKYDEANVFRKWLLEQLSHTEHDALRDPRVA